MGGPTGGPHLGLVLEGGGLQADQTRSQGGHSELGRNIAAGRCGEGQRCGASVEHSGMGSVAGAASTGASDVQAPSQERGAGLSGTVTKGEAVRGGEERARRIAA